MAYCACGGEIDTGAAAAKAGLISPKMDPSLVVGRSISSQIRHVCHTVRATTPRKAADKFLDLPVVNKQNGMQFMSEVKERSCLALLAGNPHAAKLSTFVQYTACHKGGISPPPTLRTSAYCALGALIPPLGRKAGHGYIHDATADMLPETGEDKPLCELQPGGYGSGFLCPVYTPNGTGRMLRLSASARPSEPRPDELCELAAALLRVVEARQFKVGSWQLWVFGVVMRLEEWLSYLVRALTDLRLTNRCGASQFQNVLTYSRFLDAMTGVAP